ncbi:G-protein coupled receptor GRL101-like [Lytechinus pictus]|uniref:G-protein coupled receptor GRL101-like n=1 Tax=Lytechinus pictus TaxID=7653 RepID=UPI0030B9C4CF
MASEVLRIFIWILGGSAFIGNGFVIIYRVVHQKRDRKTIVQSSFITNLAVSDFMMGLYMITIASADIYFRGNYALHADAWQSSALCKLAGMLSVVSSEASVLFIMMISVDRCIHVLLPFKKGLHLSPTAARCTQLIIWAIGVLVSVIPLMIPAYNRGNFYGQSGVCLALPLTVDRPAGWHYSISLFIGANFASFLVTLLCYVAIYIRYLQSKRMISQTGKGSRDDKKLNEDIKLAWKMLLIVGTDLICWFPIIIMGLLSAAGKLVISAQVYAWTAVFVLPVNSSLNPYLYTLSTMHGKKQKTKKSALSMTEENKTMESGLWDGDGPSKTKAIPFSIVPTMIVQFLEHWLINESRDLTRQELDVIRRDVGQSWDLLEKAGSTIDGYFKNIIVQTDAANTIQRAFVVLDPPTFNVEHFGQDDEFNGRSNKLEANQTKVLEVLKGLSESRY